MTRLFFAFLMVAIMSATYYGGKTIISDAGVKPDSPLYFFDKFLEKIELWTASGNAKGGKLIEFAKEKYAEAGAMLQGGNAAAAAGALSAGDEYAREALDFINHLKTEGAETGKVLENLGEAVVAKQEILAEAYVDAPPAAKALIQETLAKEKAAVEETVKNFSAAEADKIITQTEQTQEYIADKVSELKEQEEKAELEGLAKQEKLYNIWIENLYSVRDGGMIAVNAHIRRRDPQCSEFRGKLNLYINNTFYKSFAVSAMGYDDVRKTFDKFFLEKGDYKIKGELFDEKNILISKKEFNLAL